MAFVKEVYKYVEVYLENAENNSEKIMVRRSYKSMVDLKTQRRLKHYGDSSFAKFLHYMRFLNEPIGERRSRYSVKY